MQVATARETREMRTGSCWWWLRPLIVLLVGVAIGNYLALVLFVQELGMQPSSSRMKEESMNQQDSGVDATSRAIPASYKDNSVIIGMDDVMNSLNITKSRNDTVPGVVVLGMHRSGTSLVAGLLVKGLSYKSPGSQLLTDKHNPHGYFENKHVVMQNDVWLQQQGLAWNNVTGYIFDPRLSCTMSLSNDNQDCTSDSILHLELALLHYNLARNVPWVLKDPRLCITILSWIRALDANYYGLPAVLFIFRHPLEVAQSLKERDNISTEKGLELWIWYNRLAIENSRRLCRVVTSNKALIRDPVSEVTRIGKQLYEECRLPLMEINTAAIKNFSVMKHNEAENDNDECIVGSEQWMNIPNPTQGEREVYEKAIKVYCDLESGEALSVDYQWPALY